jgi:hypothetical protein
MKRGCEARKRVDTVTDWAHVSFVCMVYILVTGVEGRVVVVGGWFAEPF